MKVDLLKQPGNIDRGFVLVATLMILLVLTIIGLSATRLTMTELTIAGNDRVYKSTFYQADAGTELGERLVFENSICTTTNNGFAANLAPANIYSLIGDNIIVQNLTFAQNPMIIPAPSAPTVTDGNRDLAYYPTGSITANTLVGTLPNTNDALPHTNLLYQERTVVNPGSGLTMIAGYEGLGAGSIGGGTSSRYIIDSQHMGRDNSRTIVSVGWRLDLSIVNSAAGSDCIY
jgi:Tfp pilus assembly protein PilX